jgi:16S rRNA (uracil1498-N3)-methyltransferase
MSKHTFAFYKEDISAFVVEKQSGDLLSFKDSDLWNRILNIVRLRAQDHFILFDEDINVTICLHENMVNKKRFVIGTITEIQKNKKLIPEITLGIGLLKKEAWEQVAFIAAQMGATNVVPLLLDAVQRKSGGPREIERTKKMMIAACEQSKNFVLPGICEPKELDVLLKIAQDQKDCKKICFDACANSLLDTLKDIHEKKYKHIFVLIGCEGGFSDAEMGSIKKSGFDIVSLTPTILRSVESVAVGLGSIRSTSS